MSSLACCLVALLGAAPGPAPGERIPAQWERGFAFTTWWHDRYLSADAAASFRSLQATGANAVALVATWYQPGADASAVAPDRLRTPSDESLLAMARHAKSRGLRVVLRPMVDVATGESRTMIRPRSPRTWFASYERMIVHYARLAASARVDALQVGVELSALTERHERRWRRLIATTRTHYRGELSYAANWDEYARITWWDALDVIAIDAYFPLAPDARPRSEDEIVRAWHETVDPAGRRVRYLDEIAAVQRRFGKPVVFSEIGYASAYGNLIAPWRTDGIYSAEAQVNAIDAAMRALAPLPWFRGIYIWQWGTEAASGGPGDTDHAPQGKPAQMAISGWFRDAAARPAAPPRAWQGVD